MNTDMQDTAIKKRRRRMHVCTEHATFKSQFAWGFLPLVFLINSTLIVT